MSDWKLYDPKNPNQFLIYKEWQGFGAPAVVEVVFAASQADLLAQLEARGEWPDVSIVPPDKNENAQ